MFWSFASVVIYRLKSWKKWTFTWRSSCPNCKNELKVLDLFPVFSWLFLKWKCRYCKTKIPATYPLLELSTGVLFALVSYFLIDLSLVLSWNFNEIVYLFYILLISFLSIVFVFYDILYLEIPDSILWLLIILTLWYLWISSWEYWISLIWFFSILSYYTVMLWEIKTNPKLDILKDYIILTINWLVIFYLFLNVFPDSIIISALVSAFICFMIFFLQYSLSGGRILWWGDLRIAIFMWLILGLNMLTVWIMLSYISGSIIWILLILINYLRWKEFNNVVPFWPFLFLWIFTTLLFWEQIKSFYIDFLNSLI